MVVLHGHVLGQNKTVKLGIVADCQLPNNSAIMDRIAEETRTLLQSEYQVIIDDSDVLYSECNAQKAQENLDALLSRDDIDIILGVDPISSHVMANSGPYDKPVIAGIIINPQVQKLPITASGKSGVKNLVYIVLPYSPQRDLEVFHEMVDFKHLGVIVDKSTFDNIPPLGEFLKSSLEQLGVNYDFVYASAKPQEVLDQLNERIDAIYYLPSDQLTPVVQKQLIDEINRLGLPSFSLVGRSDVDQGVLAGTAPASNFDLISRRIALNIQRIMSGDQPAKINVALPHKEALVINMETARAIDYSPNWDLLSEALLINEERTDINRNISIYTAIEEALKNNLDLKIAELEVKSSEEDVAIANASALPQLDVSASHTIVDSKSAEVSVGQNPQHRGLASANFQQVIYSEQVSANKAIQKLLLKSTKSALEVQSLNVILDVSNAYFNLLRAKTSELVQKQNLEVTRKNLELARVSSGIGQSGPSDLYRWQSEISNSKANLLNATAQRAQAEMALNQLLLRPIDESFSTQEIDIEDPSIIVNDNRVGKYINNPRDFYTYVDFLVDETKRNLPELSQLDYNISAQDRSQLLFKRNLYAPTIALSGGSNYELYRGGKGAEFPAGFQVPNDLSWSVGLGASIPIFTGGQRNAQLQQSRVQLEILNQNRLNLERQLEQQTRSVLENVRASYTNIGLTKDAEVASSKNFELVQDAYSKGLVTITQLLDAQNAAISARLNSANAVYIFMIDIMTMGRATGEYFMLMTQEQKNDYANRFRTFYEAR